MISFNFNFLIFFSCACLLWLIVWLNIKVHEQSSYENSVDDESSAESSRICAVTAKIHDWVDHDKQKLKLF